MTGVPDDEAVIRHGELALTADDEAAGVVTVAVVVVVAVVADADAVDEGAEGLLLPQAASSEQERRNAALRMSLGIRRR